MMTSKITRRRLGLGLVAAAAAFLAAAPAVQAQTNFGTIQVVNSGTLFLWGAAYIADDKGFFKEQGVTFEEVIQQNAQTVLNAVINGDAAYGLGSTNDVIIANSRGQQLRTIALLTQGFPNTLIVTKRFAAGTSVTEASPISERLLALKGKTVALTVAGGPIDIVMQNMLRSAGINAERDLTLTYSGSGTAVGTAIRTGQVDAALVGSPWSDEALASGNGVKWIDLTRGDFEPLRDMDFSVLFARADTLAKNPAQAQAMVTAVAKALDYIQKDKEGARAALRRKFSRMDAAVFNLAYDNIYPAYPKTPVVTEKGYVSAMDIVNGRPTQAKVNVPYSQVVDVRFAEAAAAQIK